MLAIIRRVLRLSGDLAPRLRLSFVMSFVDAVFEMMPIGCLFWVLSQAVAQTLNAAAILIAVSVLVAAMLGRFACKYLVCRLQSAAGFDFVARERIAVGDHLRSLPMGFFSRRSIGEVTSIMTSDLNFLELYSINIMDKVVTGAVCLVAVSAFMLVFDWRIGIVFVAGVAVSLVVYGIMQKKSIALAARYREVCAQATAATIEYVQGIECVKAYNMAGGALSGIREAFDESSEAAYALERTFSPLNAIYELCFKAAAAVMLGVAAYLAIQGVFDLPTLAVVLVATFLAFTPIQVMGQLTQMIRIMDASLDRVESIQGEPGIDEGASAAVLDSFGIELSRVSFSYGGDGGQRAIDGVGFAIPQGSTCALVGPSGSGKTTLAHLIARFYDVDEGSIVVGGSDVRDMTCDSLLSHISMVFQGVYLFSDTIRENIAFGRPDATDEDVVRAAQAACCHDFISALPEGYDTVVGEGGGTLSGGERQRIAIARAILKDAPIVILDEATASIDPENERDIQRALSALAHGKTVITIAHRLSTIRDADQIIVLDRGSIADRGTHDELMATPGIYRDFWDVLERAGAWRLAVGSGAASD